MSNTVHNSEGPYRRLNGGYALLLVMIALGITVVVSMGVLTSLRPATVMADNSRHGAEALAVAEGGLDAVEAFITDTSHAWSSDPSPKSEGWWLTDTTLGGGVFSIYAERTDGDPGVGNESFSNTDRVTLTSHGTVSGVTAIATRVVSLPADPDLYLLFVVRDSTLTTDEQNYKTLFESWNWAVDTALQSESESALLTKAADNDVVFWGNVSNATLDDKLRDTPKGVVQEEVPLYDEMGFSSGSTTFSDDQVDIVDASHEITDEFGTGVLTILSSNSTLCYLSGTIAPDFTTLGERVGGSNPLLGVLEVGDTLQDGGTAAGRRVKVPWATSGFDHYTMNANANALLKASIEWAALPGTPSVNSDDPHIQVEAEIELKSGSYIDSYDSGVGAYSGGSAQSNAVIASNTTSGGKIKLEGDVDGDVYCGVGGDPNSVIDLSGGGVTGDMLALTSALDTSRPSAPSGFPGSSGDLTVSSNTTLGSTGSGTQLTYSKIEVKSGRTLTIRGDVEIKVTDEAKFEENSNLVLDSGATLKLYVNKKLEVLKSVDFNDDSTRTGDLEVYLYASDGYILIDEQAEVAGFLHAADKFEIKKNADVYGRIIVGENLIVEEDAAIHADENLNPP